MTKTLARYLMIVSSLVGVTGIFLFIFQDAYRWWRSDNAPVIHPAQSWFLKAHILSAPLFVFVFGVVWMAHSSVKISIKEQRGKRTGLSSSVLVPVMVLSGYFIQTITDDPWVGVFKWIHIVSSALFLGSIVGHLIVARKLKSRET